MVEMNGPTSGYATQDRLIPDERCAFCDTDLRLYQMANKWICRDHIAFTVSLAANDIWPNLVSYKRAFEKVLL